MRAYINMITTPLRFGPVRPTVQRTDLFRSQYIAAMSFGYDPRTNGFGFKKDLEALTNRVSNLRNMVGNYNLQWPVSTLKHIDYESDILVQQAIEMRENQIKGKSPDDSSSLVTLMKGLCDHFDKIFNFFIADPEKLEAAIRMCTVPDPAFSRYLAIRRNLVFMRNFCIDRAAFAEQKNAERARSSFTDAGVIDRLSSMYCNLEISRDRGTRRYILDMMAPRLLILLNNMIFNSYTNDKGKTQFHFERIWDHNDGAPIDGVSITVKNYGSRLFPELFKPSGNGLIRLVDFGSEQAEISHTRFYEILDIVAIQNGTFSVGLYPEGYSEYWICLPVIKRHEAEHFHR